MVLSYSLRFGWLSAILVGVMSYSTAFSQTASQRQSPVTALTRQPPSTASALLADRMRLPTPPQRPSLQVTPNGHPIDPALAWARSGKEYLDQIHDYSATLVKRERVNGKLGEEQYLHIRVRHKPFSVYIYFLGPRSVRGREVIYVDGKNDGNMLAHGVGIEKAFGTMSLPPTGMIAMRGQRYPLPDIGVLNLVTRLIQVAENDRKKAECEVKFFEGAEINKRKCTCIQVVHPVPRRDFLFHLARIFVDDELNVPIRYESYSWPTKPGGEPELLEQYTYVDIKMNNGFDDSVFDIRNPQYGFNEGKKRRNR